MATGLLPAANPDLANKSQLQYALGLPVNSAIPKRIEEVYGALPEDARDAIAKRDANT